MTARYFILGLLLWSLQACGPEATPKEAPLPDWAIPEDRMTDIMTDVHILEGARIGKRMIGDTNWAHDHYQRLWEKYNINEAIYDSNFRLYSKNAERMDRIYEEVMARLTEMTVRQANPGATEERPADKN